MGNMIWNKFNEVDIETDKKYVGIRNGKRANKDTKSWFKHDAIWFKKREDGTYVWNADDFLYDEVEGYLYKVIPDVFDYYCKYPELTSDNWILGMPTKNLIKFGKLYFVKVNVDGSHKVLLCPMRSTVAYGDSFSVLGKQTSIYYFVGAINPKDVVAWMPLPRVPEDVDSSGLFRYNEIFYED